MSFKTPDDFNIPVKTVALVIPIKNEDVALFDFIHNIESLRMDLNRYDADLKVYIVDDTIEGSKLYQHVINSRKFKEIDFITRIRGVGNYGKSIILGFIHAVHDDIVILMDIDHPLDLIPHMVISILHESDMVIGQDVNGNSERVVTKFICDNLFGIKLAHPTCGFMAFRGDALLYKIPFYDAESKRDIIHLEFILMAMRNNLKISTRNFCTKDSNIKHNYNVKRNMLWLIDAFKMKIYDVIYNKYHVDRFINENDEVIVVESN